MSSSKGAAKALRLSLPGAPEVWHYIPGGVPGLYHPVIPTPIETIGLSPDEAQVLHDNESLHLELVDVTPAEVKSANAALRKASQGALGGARTALRDLESPEERDRVLEGATAAQAITSEPEA